MKRLLFLVLCIIVLTQSDITAQNYTDYYKGDTIIRADKNTYSIKYTKLFKSPNVFIKVNNINNVKNELINGPVQTFLLQDKKVFDEVVKELFSQDELKAMYKEMRALPSYNQLPTKNLVFTFGISINRHTEKIGNFEVYFYSTPASRNISLEKIEQLENQLRRRVSFWIFDGRRQFLQSYDFFRHDFVRVYYQDVIDNFDSLCEE